MLGCMRKVRKCKIKEGCSEHLLKATEAPVLYYKMCSCPCNAFIKVAEQTIELFFDYCHFKFVSSSC